MGSPLGLIRGSPAVGGNVTNSVYHIFEVKRKAIIRK